VKSKYLIIWSKQGQLANRIIYFAHIIAFAHEYGFKVVNLTFYDYSKYFNELNDDFLCRYPKAGFSFQLPLFFRKILYRLVFIVGTKLRNWNSKYLLYYDYPNEEESLLLTDPSCFALIKKSKIVLLKGWLLRDFESLNKHKEIIKKFFCPEQRINAKIGNFISNLRKTNSIIVGIHIRRGDYKDFLGGKYYYSFDIYKRVMNRLVGLMNSNITFLICSNESIDDDVFSDFSYVVGLGEAVEDIYSLSECDYIIGPPSTFSIWASFYGNKPLYHINDASKLFLLSDFFVGECLE
jgi:hypothetical protein